MPGTDDLWGGPPDLTGCNVALVLVDLQYGATHRDFGWPRFHRLRGHEVEIEAYLERVEMSVLPNVQRLLAAFRTSGRPRVFLTVASQTADHSDRPAASRRHIARWQAQGLPIPFAALGTRAAAVRDEIAALVGEPVLNKVTASAFNSSNLDLLLRNWGADVLVFAGVATNYCVEGTLRDAADLGYDCVLVEDACAAPTHAAHRTALASMEPFASITSTSAVIEQIARAGAPLVPTA